MAGGTYTGGTIFRIATDGAGYEVLHSFFYFDGQVPYGSLHLSASSLYGMTAKSGANDFGTIFRMNTDGSGFTVLHNFAGGSEGAYPHGSLIQSGSTLYGMTTGFQGGAISGLGTIFRIETDGTGFETLHAFSLTDGVAPYGSLVQSGSTLYGMTYTGGDNGYGTIFRIQIDGTGFEVMHAFDVEDGLNPYDSLLLSGSTLYGMTANDSGGSAGAGTIFQIGIDGKGFRMVHAFSGPDGGYPYGSLIQADSILYGMTAVGGDFADGTVFSIPIPEPSGLAVVSIAIALVLRPRRSDPRIDAQHSNA